MELFTTTLFSLELLKTEMPNILQVAIEVVLGKDKRKNKLKLMSVYHWEIKKTNKKPLSEFLYFADFPWMLKHPPRSLVWPIPALTRVRLEQWGCEGVPTSSETWKQA